MHDRFHISMISCFSLLYELRKKESISVYKIFHLFFKHCFLAILSLKSHRSSSFIFKNLFPVSYSKNRMY